MTPLVTAAVLLAAVTHASWNAIAHRITDKLVGFTLIAGGGVLIGLALMPFVAVPAAGAWPYLLVSAAIHVLYYVLLMRSFRLGDFGQAYPIARGTAPLVVTVLAAVFAHEVPNAGAAAGMADGGAGSRDPGVRPLPPALPALPRPTALRRPGTARLGAVRGGVRAGAVGTCSRTNPVPDTAVGRRPCRALSNQPP